MNKKAFKKTFAEALKNNEVTLEDVDKYLHEWNESDFEGEFYEYLGMTEEEFGKLIERITTDEN